LTGQKDYAKHRRKDHLLKASFPEFLAMKLTKKKSSYGIGNALRESVRKIPLPSGYPFFQLRTLSSSSFVSFATEPQHVSDRLFSSCVGMIFLLKRLLDCLHGLWPILFADAIHLETGTGVFTPQQLNHVLN
jgi:hypothetical protein